jgi:hypothetical protein
MLTELTSNERHQSAVLLCVSIVVCGLAALLYLSGSAAFRLFVGRINPLVATIGVEAVGGLPSMPRRAFRERARCCAGEFSELPNHVSLVVIPDVHRDSRPVRS